MDIFETEILLHIETGAVRRNTITPDQCFRFHDGFSEADQDAGWKQVGTYGAGCTEEDISAGIEHAKATYCKAIR